MLIIAGTLFVLAMLLLFVDKYMDMASINAIVYHVYKSPQFLNDVEEFFAAF